MLNNIYSDKIFGLFLAHFKKAHYICAHKNVNFFIVKVLVFGKGGCEVTLAYFFIFPLFYYKFRINRLTL